MILFLPPYSPDLNPIEESFAVCEYACESRRSVVTVFTGKAYLRRHVHLIREADDPIGVLQDTTACITAEMAFGWFKHAGYIF